MQLATTSKKKILTALISFYAVRNPSLQFSEPQAAYLAGVYWTGLTGGRVISVIVLMLISTKQLLVVSHTVCICASGEFDQFRRSAFQRTRRFRPVRMRV